MATFSTSLHDLQTQLSQLESMISQANPDATALQQYFLTVQQHFQVGILGITQTLPEALAVAAQPLLVEMNRTFRLLGMDIAFLQTARNPLTQQQRQKQMRDRIRQLHNFCRGLIGLENNAVDTTEE
ncbi:MAG TPA: heterocyst frequency control protein PatD [Leptolyngbyaceae cyanobacterium]